MAGSSRLAGTAIADPTVAAGPGAGSTLTWNAPFTVPPTSSRDLSFKVLVSDDAAFDTLFVRASATATGADGDPLLGRSTGPVAPVTIVPRTS